MYQYDPADPNPEQQATKPALSTPEEPEATAPEATQANAPAADPTTPTAPAADPPAEGSVKNPTKNVIRVINDWAEKVLKIRLSNVNIKQDDSSTYADGKKEESIGRVSGMTVKEAATPSWSWTERMFWTARTPPVPQVCTRIMGMVG